MASWHWQHVAGMCSHLASLDGAAVEQFGCCVCKWRQHGCTCAALTIGTRWTSVSLWMWSTCVRRLRLPVSCKVLLPCTVLELQSPASSKHPVAHKASKADLATGSHTSFESGSPRLSTLLVPKPAAMVFWSMPRLCSAHVTRCFATICCRGHGHRSPRFHQVQLELCTIHRMPLFSTNSKSLRFAFPRDERGGARSTSVTLLVRLETSPGVHLQARLRLSP